jgi:uncharacterized protein YndB with AHSA1/START domain
MSIVRDPQVWTRAATAVAVLLAALVPLSVRGEPLPAKPGPEWKIGRSDSEISIFWRDAPGNARELRVIGTVRAPPATLFYVVTDFENYPKYMPYAREARVLKRTGDVALVYTLSAPPVIAPRDLVAEITMTRGTPASGGVYRSEWVARPDQAPVRSGVVRVRLSTGSWTLEPIDGGKSTRVTYSIITNPGGNIPRAFADQSTNGGMVDLFNAIRRRATGS